MKALDAMSLQNAGLLEAMSKTEIIELQKETWYGVVSDKLLDAEAKKDTLEIATSRIVEILSPLLNETESIVLLHLDNDVLLRQPLQQGALRLSLGIRLGLSFLLRSLTRRLDPFRGEWTNQSKCDAGSDRW